MALHWTYREVEEGSELEQGDILVPSPELRDVFEEVHPHFLNQKYVGFLVTTQTCDMVRRNKVPKTPYINLAAIRPLSQVCQKIFAHFVKPLDDGIFPLSAKPTIQRKLETLFNQNEQSLGLFFLQKGADLGIGEPSVAFLRVAVALRSAHYQTLVDCRKGRLRADFQAKLGWLCGNLFDRPATPDWTDNEGSDKTLSELVSHFMTDGDIAPKWCDDAVAREAKAKGYPLANLTDDQRKELTPKPSLDVAVEVVGMEAKKLNIDDAIIEKLKNRLRNNGPFRKLHPPTQRIPMG